MSKIVWVIDEYLLKETLSEKLPQVIKDLGIECITTKYVPFSDTNDVFGKLDLDYEYHKKIFYGTHGFIKQARSSDLDDKYIFCNEKALEVKTWASKNLPRLLNDNGHFSTLGIISHNYYRYAAPFFIRPNSVTKTFGGQVVDPVGGDEVYKQIQFILDTSSASLDTLVFVAPIKEIKAEYRLVVVDKEIVGYSQYRRDGVLDIRRDIMQGALDVAKEAINVYAPDDVFVIDIAELTNGQFKVIEYNSFSCAGMYACDMGSIVENITKYVKDN